MGPSHSRSRLRRLAEVRIFATERVEAAHFERLDTGIGTAMEFERQPIPKQMGTANQYR